MAVNEFLTEEDYQNAFRSNSDARAKIQNYLGSLQKEAGTEYERMLYNKPTSELTDQEKNILGMDGNEYIFKRRELIQLANKKMKELERRNKALRKEYVDMNKADIDGLVGNDTYQDIKKELGVESGEVTEPTEPAEVVAPVANVPVPGATQLPIPGETGVPVGSPAQSVVVPAGTNDSGISGTSGGTFESAINTGKQAVESVEKQAANELIGAGIAAAKEGGYAKGLASRTGSSMGEAGLAADKQAARFSQEAANINAQKQAQKQQALSNVASIQQSAANVQAQMDDAKLARMKSTLRNQ